MCSGALDGACGVALRTRAGTAEGSEVGAGDDHREQKLPPRTSPQRGIRPRPTSEVVYEGEGTWQVSEWIDPDSKDSAVAKASAEALKQEMGWATHLSLQGVMLRPRSADSVAFAHLTNQLLQGLHHMQVGLTSPASPAPYSHLAFQWCGVSVAFLWVGAYLRKHVAISVSSPAWRCYYLRRELRERRWCVRVALQLWVRVPAAPEAGETDKGKGKAQEEGGTEAEAEAEQPERVMDAASGLARGDPYVWWHQFRTICDNHPALGVCLELSAELPAPELLRRWMGEPLKVRRSASLRYVCVNEGEDRVGVREVSTPPVLERSRLQSGRRVKEGRCRSVSGWQRRTRLRQAGWATNTGGDRSHQRVHH